MQDNERAAVVTALRGAWRYSASIAAAAAPRPPRLLASGPVLPGASAYVGGSSSSTFS